MFTKKFIGLLATSALALFAWSGSALASPITVYGVTWDRANPIDLTVQSINLRETSIGSVGDTLTGYGQIGSINGNNDFCSGCDLTFTFSYQVQSISGSSVIFNNGMFNFYVSSAGSYSVLDPTTASMGTPWVTLAGHTYFNPTYGSFGQLFATVSGTVADPTLGSGGTGLLDVTGGAAAKYWDSNTVSDGLGGFADFSLASSFQYFPANTCGSVSSDPTSLCHYPITGNGSLVGRTNVPEPAGIGLLGLGLGFLGLAMHRRRKESNTRA